MDFIDKDVLLQQILEKGKWEREQLRLLFRLNSERTVTMEIIGQAISYLREARDLLEAEEYKIDSRILIANERVRNAEQRLEMDLEVMATLFEKDFEKKREEESTDECVYYNDFEKLQARHKERPFKNS